MLPSDETASDSVIRAYMARLSRALALVPSAAVARAVDLLLEARAQRRCVYVMGNGGSAATASHFVCDLVKTAHVAGCDPVRAFALADNTPLLTAWANDRAYERVFAEQVEALVDVDDVVVAISASGRSPNIIAGLTAATRKRARKIGLIGFDGGDVLDLVEVAIHVPSHEYGVVEDAHCAIAHAVTATIRRVLEGTGGPDASTESTPAGMPVRDLVAIP